jgi:DegV family protein with EDD domain
MTLFDRIRRLIPRGTSEGAAQRPSHRLVRVVTDSTADLPPELAADLGISVVPLQIIFGEETFRDGIDMDAAVFFQRLSASKELPRTSQPSAGDFVEVYERLALETDRILSIHLSSGFSGTVETARQAAQELTGRVQIEVIDSHSVSMAMGLAVIEAARAAQAGGDLSACADTARSVLRRTRIAVTLESLEYLRRGGRIGRAQALLGGLLRIKPILTIRDGEAFPLARARTRQKALDEMRRLCLEQGRITEAAVMQATTPDDARYLADQVAQRFPGAPVHVGQMGPVIGVHGGPGLIGLAVVLAEEPPPAEGASA